MLHPYSLLGIIILILDIVAFVDIFKSSMDTLGKVLWALVVLFFPVLGMILYFLFGRKS